MLVERADAALFLPDFQLDLLVDLFPQIVVAIRQGSDFSVRELRNSRQVTLHLIEKLRLAGTWR
jgi:hypothetical protein